MFGYQWTTVLGYWPEFLHAAWLTVAITVLAFGLALALALAAAVARNSPHVAVRLPASIYVEVIRNTPVLLQIFVVFFALPSLGIRLSAFVAGVIALGVNVGAYLAEGFRAGINDVPTGQLEAARILNLNRFDTFWRVVFPQAMRKVYPTLVNNAILTLLGTSLLSALAVPELTGQALVVNARTLLFVQVFGILLAFYLALSIAISYLGSVIGRYAFKPPLPRRRRLAGLAEVFNKRNAPKALQA
jgi:polar amino acid transport system permease protein